MVNKIVLEYLRANRGNYKLEELKKKILVSGYTQKDVDEAMNQLNRQSQTKVPSIPATINKINNTNIDLSANAPTTNNSSSNAPTTNNSSSKDFVQIKPLSNKSPPNKKKTKTWLKWLIIIWSIILVLGVIGFGVWYWLGSSS